MTTASSLFKLTLLISGICLGLCGETASAQGLASVLAGGKPTASATATSNDPLNRLTPRQSVYSFLEACHANNFTKASKYLDLRKLNPEDRAKEGPVLAQQLAAILDHDPQFDITNLNDAVDGDHDDGLTPDIDDLETLQLNGKPVSLQMQRVDRGGTKVWVVSAESVAKIPALSVLAAGSSFERAMPAPLVNIKILNTSLWIWIALTLVAVITSIFSRLLSQLVLLIIRPVATRYGSELPSHTLKHFTEPLRLLLGIMVFRASIEAFTPSALLRLYIDRVLTLLFFLGTASLAMRLVDVVGDRLRLRVDTKQGALSQSFLPLGERIAKICIFGAAVLLTLDYWGYHTNTILAGLGVGGLAVALAAQKTIENLFGGVSVISDRPVLVGDFCQFGGQVGTIEDIGLRSTKIRTLDRTVVTIPNSQFSTMTLENYSRRDRMWFHPTVSVRRDSTPKQVEAAMEAITDVLKKHPSVDPTDVPVRFTKVGLQSFDIEVFSYVQTSDFNEYLKVQSELLLQIMTALYAIGINFAMPVQESIVAADDGKGPDRYRSMLPGSQKTGHMPTFEPIPR